MLSLGLALAFGVMLSFSASDLLAKRVSAKIGSKRTTLIMLSASLATMLVLAVFIGLSKIGTAVISLSIISGMIYALSNFLLYKSLETEQVSNTLSLAGIEYGLITVFSILIFGETITALEVIGVIGILLGAFLATTNRKLKFNVGYAPAIFGMVGFAISYVPLIFAQQYSGGPFAPLIINRIIALSMMGLYLKASPEKDVRFEKVKFRKAGYAIIASNVFVGVFNAVASMGLLALASISFLALGSAIVAAEPAVVILLGYLLYKDRFEKHQIIGFIALISGTLVLVLG